MSLLKRLLPSLLRILLLTLVAIVILLLLFQNKLIYHPHPYAPGELAQYPSVIQLAYTTSQGPQRAYYLPPRDTPLHRLWVLFPGNGSCALDWATFADAAPDSHAGFLMIDYPGYGACAGAPSPSAIEESAESAFTTLAQTLHTTPAALDSHLGLLCHSLGCATGLNFAIHHPVDRLLLLAPFTSLRAMARRTVGWPLCYLLRRNYDNRARLTQLAARPAPPAITIFHGDADSTIPISMSESLAAQFPRLITFHPIQGATHNSILSDAAPQITAAMHP